jgi:RNA polymerase sigma factor (sigma-70 family)
MATGRLETVLRHLRGALDDATDCQLLQRFLASRDEQAFEALVRRHGPMVLGICGRVLGNADDAEDAFQATFLVLARRAASVRKRGALGSWLYGVARHVALHAKRAAARRRAREAKAMPRAESKRDDLREVLDLELERLPEKYRAPLVLCDLEGRTRKEAARQLGLPQGTVASRLARGRTLLARRLSRHGWVLTAGALGLLLSEVASAVPAPLVGSTVKAAVLVAAGQVGAVATPVAALVKEATKAMFVMKLKVVVLVAALLGAGGLVYRAAGQVAPPDKPLADPESLRKENELLRLNVQVLLEKVRALEAELAALKAQTGAAAKQALLDRARAKEAELEAAVKTQADFDRDRLAASRTRSQDNLKQMGRAFHNYADANGGSFPLAALCDPRGKPLLSWRVAILPFLEQDALYKEFRLDEPWDSEHNKKLLGRMPAVYALPGVSMKQPGLTPYQVFVGKDSLFEGARKPSFPADIPDGTSNTLLVVEGTDGVPWTKPADIPFDDRDPRSRVGGWYGDVFDVLTCDGAVRTLDRKKVSEETFRNAIMPADGHVLGKDW